MELADAMLCRSCGGVVPMYLVAAGVKARDDLWDECGGCGDVLLFSEEFEGEGFEGEAFSGDDDQGEWF